VPKAGPDVLAARHADAPEVALIPLVESAAAMTQVTAIASCAGVRTLAIGEVDLAADLGLGDDVPDAVRWALRMQVVVACAATGRGAPLGPVIGTSRTSPASQRPCTSSATPVSAPCRRSTRARSG
jgi:citrate lyase subunit beta/citryl-CoA lyase